VCKVIVCRRFNRTWRRPLFPCFTIFSLTHKHMFYIFWLLNLQLGWCPCHIIPWHGPRIKPCFQQYLYCCAWAHCHMSLYVSRLLCSNGSTRYIAPSLRLFVLNSLPAYCHFFSSEGCTCDVCDWSCFPSVWHSSHRDYSPTAPTAPSLRPLILGGFLIRCQLVQVYCHHPSPSQCRQKFREWSMLLHPWLLICC
jgi:hypothetical protein